LLEAWGFVGKDASKESIGCFRICDADNKVLFDVVDGNVVGESDWLRRVQCSLHEFLWSSKRVQGVLQAGVLLLLYPRWLQRDLY